MTRAYRQTSLAFLVTALVLGFGILLFFIVFPLLRKVTETQKRIAEDRGQLQALAAEIANYKSLSAQLSKVEAQKQSLATMFPAREDMVYLVAGLESAIDQTGLSSKLSLTDIKEKQEQNPAAKEKPLPPLVAGISKLEEIPYTLKVAGDYRALTDLLLRFEHLPFITVPDKLSVAADTAQAADPETFLNVGTATAKLEGVLFILSP